MSFIAPIPALIAAAITLPLLVALYFLKLRRRPMAVPSTLLWRKAIQDLQVNSPFQKLRNSLLLWLQLLLLALLLFAFARPADDAAAVAGDRVAILIDHSASMSATDIKDSRLDGAKQAARDVVDNLDSGAAAMIVSFAQSPRVRQQFTTDRAALRRAIDSITPTDQRTNLGPALHILEPHAGSTDGKTALSVVVIGDGKISDANGSLPGVAGLPGIPGIPGVAVRYLPVGRASVNNVGIVACDARRGVDDPSEVEVFARLVNFGATAVTTNITLKIEDAVISMRQVVVPGHRANAAMNPGQGGDRPEASQEGVATSGGEWVVSFTLRLPENSAIEVSHDHDDALTSDNTARLLLTAARRLRVLVVSPGDNPFLAEAVSAAGVDTLKVVTPAVFDEQDMTGAGYDVVVFDRWAPKFAPVTNTLNFGVVPAIPGLALREAQEDAPQFQRALTWATDEPVMRYVALDDLVVRRPGRLVLPANATVLATGLSGPMMALVTYEDGGATSGDASRGTSGGGRTRHVAVAFDVRESRWPLSWSYQVFMVNALEVLGLGAAGDEAALAHRPGDAVSVESTGSSSVSFTGPITLRAPVRGGWATLPVLERVGWYRTADAAVPAPHDRLAVNLLDENESDLRVAKVLRVGSASGATTAAGENTVRREWWPWLLSAALALLCVEWWVYTRRMAV